ncbi:hypothetical protein Lal_00033956 [Lupinus albus]|nr:hypothetical protein Lal_00033956 [Lupinus albus]
MRMAKVVCANPDYGWIAYCARDNKLITYQLKTFNREHICYRTFKNKTARRDWVAKKLESKLVAHSDLRRNQAITLMKEDFLVHLDKKKELRCYIMRIMRQHKIAIRNWNEKLLPGQERRLEKIKVLVDFNMD